MSNEKKVYRANKKAIIIIIAIALVVFVIGLFAEPVMNTIHRWYLNRWSWHDVAKYHFEVNLPRAYEELQEKKTDTTGISTSSFLTDTNVAVNEEYVSQIPETVYYGKNSLNDIVIKIQCLTTDKTDRTLEDLADSQHVLVRIAYEDDYAISDPRREYVTILDTLGVRTAADLSNEDGEITIINYLVPMEDKEVTISFFGWKENMEKAEEEIEKIVKEMRTK